MNPLLNPTGYLIGVGVKKIVESISESGQSTTIDELEDMNGERKSRLMFSWHKKK